MTYHITSNWLGEPCRVPLDPDPDEQIERMRDEVEIQNALDAQLKLFLRAEQGAQKERVA